MRLGDRRLNTVKAYVSRSNLRHNALVLRRYCSSSVELCAVLKANAYGHDSRSVACSLNGRHVDRFAVATIEEAEQVFPFARGKPILVTSPLFDGLDGQLIKLARARGFHCTVCSHVSLEHLESTLEDSAQPLNVQVKLDTGMGRLGCSREEAGDLTAAIRSSCKMRLTGVYTHFATADEADEEYARGQLATFEGILDETALRGQSGVLKHACNTSATLRFPAAHFDMVRCGIGLYGYLNMAGNCPAQAELRPALRVEAPLVQVRNIPAGQCCGYGRDFVAPRDMTIGIVPVGYADGLLRQLSNRVFLRVGSVNTAIVGRISMDLTIIDLTKVPSPREGMAVTIIDDQPESPCSAAALAKLGDTIPYEILTAVGSRVKRCLVD